MFYSRVPNKQRVPLTLFGDSILMAFKISKNKSPLKA